MEENCYTKDILYSSHIKNALQIAMWYQENYSLDVVENILLSKNSYFWKIIEHCREMMSATTAINLK